MPATKKRRMKKVRVKTQIPCCTQKKVLFGIIVTIAIMLLLPYIIQFIVNIISPMSIISYKRTVPTYKNLVIEIAKYEAYQNIEFNDSELNFMIKLLNRNNGRSKVKVDLQFINRELVGEIYIDTFAFTKRDKLHLTVESWKTMFMKIRQKELDAIKSNGK